MSSYRVTIYQHAAVTAVVTVEADSEAEAMTRAKLEPYPEWTVDDVLTPHRNPESRGEASMTEMTKAAADVLSERKRQIEVEGFLPDDDDYMQSHGQMAQAAACYALHGTPGDEAQYVHGRWLDARDMFWPSSWERDWYKPTTPRRDLVKAAALILAEIERLDRAEGGAK